MKINVDPTKVRLPVRLIALLKPFLDVSYRRIDAKDDASRDKAIKKCIETLKEDYKDLTTGPDVDYSAPECRFAYVYKYVACHANLLVTLIGRVPALAEVFKRERASVVALGGGPGTEILGIGKYLSQNNLSPTLDCTVYDREMGWGDTWHNLDKEVALKPNEKMFRQFKYFDVTQERTWTGEKVVLESDLFLMVYFVSELYKHRAEAADYFKHLFSKARKGSLFVFIDNSDPPCFRQLFDSWTDRCEVLATADREWIVMAWEEEKLDFGEYFERFEDPKIKSGVCYRVVRKK
jgi:hypothetical protein